MIRYPLPEDAIPVVPYEGEPPLWHVFDEAIAVADEDHYRLCRAIENMLLIIASVAMVGLVVWLAI